MPGKSINVPNVHLSNPPLTPRDKEQIEYCISREWDFISASFIRTVDDAQQVTKLTKGSHTKVIAKIEDQQGIDNFDAILAEVEGIMIARGDLGVEVPFERIPLIQKDFIKN
jgi:pyruvate kinase